MSLWIQTTLITHSTLYAYIVLHYIHIWWRGWKGTQQRGWRDTRGNRQFELFEKVEGTSRAYTIIILAWNRCRCIVVSCSERKSGKGHRDNRVRKKSKSQKKCGGITERRRHVTAVSFIAIVKVSFESLAAAWIITKTEVPDAEEGKYLIEDNYRTNRSGNFQSWGIGGLFTKLWRCNFYLLFTSSALLNAFV